MKSKTSEKKAKLATARSNARYARAARTVPQVTLDSEHARKLDGILARTGETTADWVRRMIRETH